MESKTTQKRKKRTEEFKREAVRQLEGRGERTIADVAASLGVAENLLHSWKKKYGNAAEQVRRERGGETPEEELKRLRRENAQLKQERDVLKKSVAKSITPTVAVNTQATSTVACSASREQRAA